MIRWFVGVDGGSSRTDAVVHHADGRVAGRGRSGPSNDPAGDRMHDDVAATLCGAMGTALAEADARVDDVASVALHLSVDRAALVSDRAESWLAIPPLVPS